MISNYYTLARLTELLSRDLPSRRVLALFTQERGRLVLEIEDRPHLIAACDPRVNTLYYDPRFRRARKNTLDLFGPLRGRIITELGISPSDRVVTMRFDSEEALEFRMFGARANVLRTDRDGTILETFRKEKNPDQPSGAKSAGAPDLLTLRSGDTVGAVLKTAFPLFGSLLIREILVRSDISPDGEWNALTRTQVGTIIGKTEEIRAALRSGHPRVYAGPKGSTFSLIPLVQYEGREERTFEDLHEAIRVVLAAAGPGVRRENPRRALEERIGTMLAKAERTAGAIAADLDEHPRDAVYERFGTLLLSSLGNIPEGAAEVALQDHLGTAHIPLDPSLTPAANAQRYFDKAKRARTARRENRRRLEEGRGRISTLMSLTEELSRIRSDTDFAAFLETHSGTLLALGLTEKQQAAAQLPFRSFTVDGGFEVWAGKNSRSNDELTMRHAKPNDLWFHARGAGGSHVILRVRSAKGEPTKRSKLQAAGIAAYYSRMKGAGMVPVAMTFRKYVRKPKGAPVGTVMIEREEVLLVRPALPDNEASNRKGS